MSLLYSIVEHLCESSLIFIFSILFAVIDKQTDVRSLDSTSSEGNDVILRCSFAQDLYDVSLWITDDGVIVLPLTRTNTALGMCCSLCCDFLAEVGVRKKGLTNSLFKKKKVTFNRMKSENRLNKNNEMR